MQLKNVSTAVGVAALLALLSPQALALPESIAMQYFPTLTSALDEISSRYEVQLGLEYASGDKDNVPFTVDLATRESTSQFISRPWRASGILESSKKLAQRRNVASNY